MRETSLADVAERFPISKTERKGSCKRGVTWVIAEGTLSISFAMDKSGESSRSGDLVPD